MGVVLLTVLRGFFFLHHLRITDPLWIPNVNLCCFASVTCGPICSQRRCRLCPSLPFFHQPEHAPHAISPKSSRIRTPEPSPHAFQPTPFGFDAPPHVAIKSSSKPQPHPHSNARPSGHVLKQSVWRQRWLGCLWQHVCPGHLLQPLLFRPHRPHRPRSQRCCSQTPRPLVLRRIVRRFWSLVCRSPRSRSCVQRRCA